MTNWLFKHSTDSADMACLRNEWNLQALWGPLISPYAVQVCRNAIVFLNQRMSGFSCEFKGILDINERFNIALMDRICCQINSVIVRKHLMYTLEQTPLLVSKCLRFKESFYVSSDRYNVFFLPNTINLFINCEFM